MGVTDISFDKSFVLFLHFCVVLVLLCIYEYIQY